MGEVTTGAYDFSYNNNSKSATGGKEGKPLGDPRWVPYTGSSVNDIDIQAASAVRTYPNPFDKNVTFEIESDEVASARISVFDLLGKEVITLNKQLVKGKNSVPVNIDAAIHSGIYLYKVQLDLPGGLKSISGGKLIKN